MIINLKGEDSSLHESINQYLSHYLENSTKITANSKRVY